MFPSDILYPKDHTTIEHHPVRKSLDTSIIFGNSGLEGFEEPDASAIASSERLCSRIRDEILHGNGKISFYRFMELALYEPGLGYYSAGAAKFGESGDFVTAPEISSLFSRCIARQCWQVMGILGNANILEVGAGSGIMACDILMELEQLDALPEHYFILDMSADLRERQRMLIQQRIPHLQKHIHWLDQLPEAGFRGIVLANEVLDAMPVHRIHIGRGSELEFFIRSNNNKFEWCTDKLSHEHIQQRISAIRQILDNDVSDKGYSTEINLAAESWVRSIADIMACGVVLIIDYGFPRREYYHPERCQGTLMCHYQHHAHADPLVLTGLQDITTHIDFTAIAEAGHESGLTVAGYANQGHFLLACGLMEIANITALARETQRSIAEIKQAQEIKKLTLPHEMGELFKVLALSRGIDEPLIGFSFKNDRRRL